MILSAFSKHFNNEDTYNKLNKWVNIHNELNKAESKTKPKNPKIDIDVNIDKKKLDKKIQDELDKVMKKNGFIKK